MTNNQMTKKPLVYIEVVLNKYTESAIPYHKKTLEERKHAVKQVNNDPSKIVNQHNIIKKTEDHLKILLYELDTLRAQVEDSDLDQFDVKTVALRKSMLHMLSEYKELKQYLVKQRSAYTESEQTEENNGNMFLETKQLHISADIDEMKIKERENCLQNVEKIQNDIEELHSAYSEMHQMVNEQADQVNQVETNIEEAKHNVDIGAQHIMKASRLKTAVYPVAGAVMGGVVGGPIGLIAGFKFGGLAALTCGCLGYIGGRVLNKHKAEPTTEIDPDISYQANKDLIWPSDNTDLKKDE